MKRILRFFDRLEDRIRGFLSHYPVIYALIASTAIIVFWHGIEELTDYVGISFVAEIGISVFVLLLIGAFISFFLGGNIIMSGLKGEKKLEEKTLEETQQEEKILESINQKLDRIEEEVGELKKADH